MDMEKEILMLSHCRQGDPYFANPMWQTLCKINLTDMVQSSLT